LSRARLPIAPPIVAAVAADAITFDAVVGIVLDQFVDRRVQVFVLLPGNPTLPGLMSANGTLYSSGDIAEARRWWAPMADDEDELREQAWNWAADMTADPDRLGLSFRERNPLNGFWLDRARFVSARWSSESHASRPSLEVELLGGVTLRITDETPRPGDLDDDEDDDE